MNITPRSRFHVILLFALVILFSFIAPPFHYNESPQTLVDPSVVTGRYDKYEFVRPGNAAGEKLFSSFPSVVLFLLFPGIVVCLKSHALFRMCTPFSLLLKQLFLRPARLTSVFVK